MRCVIVLLFAILTLEGIAQYVPGQYTQFSPQDTANHNLNVIYFSVAMSPTLFGLRYDRYFEYTGAYVGFNAGRVYGGSYYRNMQVRINAGFIIKLEYIVDQIDSPILTIGGAYRHWQSVDYQVGYIDPDDAFKGFAFDFGFGGRIKRFNIAGRVDMTDFNFLLDVGYNF